MREIFKSLFYAWVVAAVLQGCGAGNKGGNEKKAKPPQPPAVQVQRLERKPHEVWLKFPGKSEAVDDVRLVARVGGPLQAWLFKPGSRVHEGELLFRIDPSEYDAAVTRTEGLLQKDLASLALARAEMRRYAPLVKEQLAPRAKFDQLKAAVAEMKAVVKADRAALEKEKLQRSYCDVRAPIDGIIGKPLVLPGNVVKPSTVLAHIVKADRLYVNFHPADHEVALMKKYAKEPLPEVNVTVAQKEGAPIVTLKGRVDFIDNETDPSTGTVAMRAVVENPKNLVLPGTFVEVHLLLGRFETIALHPDWLFYDQEGGFVYRLDNNDTLRKARVVPLFSSEELVIPQKGELKAGERIVTEEVAGLHEGMRVRPVTRNDENGTR
ncbi:efflux RND transporter periplasmic adaptor subunit [Hydrogenimonas sp. SS33]|uniref:efflux RND transporter periplasmic adaptor subunit n=1 Tax=Hydrogenimonas leucolamina TaxID=2954236 RepID=UPI00336C1AA8